MLRNVRVKDLHHVVIYVYGVEFDEVSTCVKNGHFDVHAATVINTGCAWFVGCAGRKNSVSCCQLLCFCTSSAIVYNILYYSVLVYNILYYSVPAGTEAQKLTKH